MNNRIKVSHEVPPVLLDLSKNFNDYDDLQKLDALADVLKELQIKYNEVLSRNKSLVIESLGHYIDEEEETKH